MVCYQRQPARLKNKIKYVHLCFTTDPFMYGYKEIEDITFDAIEKLNNSRIKCTVLSKGILPERLCHLSSYNEYGITLISLNEKYREKYESGSSIYKNRILSLKKLHDLGCKTWVSIEPYPTPNIISQKIDEILNSVSFTNKIIFGRTNYSKEISSFKLHKEFYNTQAQIVMNFCERNNILYHIKDGTITG